MARVLRRWGRLGVMTLTFLASIAGHSEAQRENPASIDELPAEIQLAIYGAIATVRGLDTTQLDLAVTVESQAVAGLYDSAILYHGFAVRRVGIDALSQIEGDRTRRRLLAHLVLQDPADRSVLLDLLLHYRVVETGITIEAGMARVVAPNEPDVRYFVVSASDLPQTIADHMTHAELLKLAVENDLLATPIADASRPDEYAVLAFVLDRLPAEDALILRSAGGSMVTEVADFLGFKVAIARGNFALADLGHVATFELLHLPVAKGNEPPELRRLEALAKPLTYVQTAPPADVMNSEDDIAARLRKLDELRDAGLIKQYEYEAIRQEVLDSL